MLIYRPYIVSDELLNACKEIGLALNTEKTKYMEIGRHQAWLQMSISR